MITGQYLTTLVQRRDRLKESIQRIRGRLDSARADLASVEEECRKRKIDPEKIDSVIAQLEQKLEEETQKFAQQLEQAEAQILPFLED